MTRLLTWISICLLGLLIQVPAFPQDGPRADESARSISADQRAQILKKMADEIASGYLYPEKGEQIASELRSAAATDRFDQSEITSEFVGEVNEFLLGQSDDLHLRMGFQTDHEATPGPIDSGGSKRGAVRRLPQGDGDEYHGFTAWSVLEGNVGYIDLRTFATPQAKAQADKVMMELVGTDALILDLRRNGGGGPFMVRYLSGFFFEEPTHLTTTFMRGWDAPEERWTLTEGRPTDAFVDKPVYVLTSGHTFSAAESFTFGLAINDRITTVGQQTGGGGHFGRMVDLGDGFRFFLPRGRTYDPETGRGWEAEGIQPDIETPQADALDVALGEATDQLGPPGAKT